MKRRLLAAGITCALACAAEVEDDDQELVVAGLGGNNLSGVNLGGVNLGGVNLGAANLRLGLGESPSAAKPRLEPLVPVCRVVGFGSLPFARLLGEYSALSPLSVELAKLTDNLLGTGAPAWQAVVRGDRGSCTFVIPAPVGVSVEGVAGFIKAVFRWSAPPTQEVSIAFPGAPAPVRHRGMMNAAAHWRAGRVNQRSFLAGELAFVTANTNSRSMSVDFASWVRDVSGQGLVLGNVEADNPPSRAESVYYAVEGEGGHLAVEVAGAVFGGRGAPVIDSYRELAGAWQAYQEGRRGRPEPRRCGAALWLAALDGQPPPAGMCDDGLPWTAAGSHRDARSWASLPGTTAPMNDYMLLPADAQRPLLRARPGAGHRVVLSETYVHIWQPSFD